MRYWIETVAGAAACAALAAVVAAFAPDPMARTAPIWFLIIIVALAWRYGAAAGIAGTLLAVLVFAIYLYAPIGSPFVANDAARQRLSWMLLAGIVSSYLLAPRETAVRSKNPQSRS